MSSHPQFDEDFDLQALGALEGDESDALELHLAHCDACRERADAARGRMALLGLAAPALAPPPEVRERLLRRIRVRAVLGTATRPAGWLRWVTPALALAAIVLAVATGVLWRQNSRLVRRTQDLEAAAKQQAEAMERARDVLDVLTSPETIRVALVPNGTKPVPRGRALYNTAKGRLLFSAVDLPALPAGRTYELWLIPVKGDPIGAGVFQPDAKGNGEVVLPTLEAGVKAKAFAVTVEPAGGVPKPTGSMVMVGPVS